MTEDRDITVAAFTMVYNDAAFLSIWRNYYGSALGAANLFVLDHGSNDGSTDALGETQVLRVPRSRYYDEDQRSLFISRCHAALLKYYDVVIFTDADEILIPDPDRYTGLKQFIQRRCARLVTAVGLELYHVPDIEQAIDLSLPVLSQRSYVRFSAAYCKSLISGIPLVWDPGFHGCNHPSDIDPDLYLLHLKRMDRGMALRRLRTTRAIQWSSNARRKGHGEHHRLQDEAFIARMFPYSAQTLEAVLSPGFDFSADLARIATNEPRHFSDYEGAVATLPPRFKEFFAAAMKPVDHDPAQARDRTNMRAYRALRQVILKQVVRERLGPLADRLIGWLKARTRLGPDD